MGKNFARPNNKRSLPNVFNKKQLIKLFENLDESALFMGSLIALFCGLRISEVCELKKQDIDLEAEKVFVRQSKGDKDRIVMLPNAIKSIVHKWMRAHKDSEYFICSDYKNKFNKNFFSLKFGKALEKANLRIKTFKSTIGQQRYAYSFHTLRHTYATYLLEQGVDLYYVQRSLGHVDIHTTQIYAYISNKDLQNKINFAFGKKVAKKEAKGISDPMQILKMRFVNDEINLEEYKEKIEVMKEMDAVIF